jgi:hypothetical protein
MKRGIGVPRLFKHRLDHLDALTIVWIIVGVSGVLWKS